MNEIVKVETDSGQIELSGDVVRRTLCDNPNVTDREVDLFIGLCKAQHLNPFIKEAHIVKYGTNPATMIVGKDVFTKRAQKNPRFKGLKAGLTFATNGKLARREGSLLLPGEEIIGGWCKVYIDGYKEPMYDEVSFNEYAGRKKDGSLNSQWSSKPGTMIRKVAMVHALREAFPDDFAGLYDEAEMAQSVPEDPRPLDGQADTLRTLWKGIGDLKAKALSMGIREEGIVSWMDANILSEDGAPKPRTQYTEADIASLSCHIKSLMEDMRSIEETLSDEPMEVEAEVLDLYDEDVMF